MSGIGIGKKCNCCMIYSRTFTSFDSTAFTTVSGSTPSVVSSKLRISNAMVLFKCRARQSAYDFGTGYSARPVSIVMSGIEFPAAGETLKIYTRYSDSNNCDYIELTRESLFRYVAVISGTPTVLSNAVHWEYQTDYTKVDSPNNGVYDHSGGGTYADCFRRIISFLDGRTVGIEFRISNPIERSSPAICNGYKSGTVKMKLFCDAAPKDGDPTESVVFTAEFPLFTLAGNHAGIGYWGFAHSGSYYCDIGGLSVYSVDDSGVINSPPVAACTHEEPRTHHYTAYAPYSYWNIGSPPSYVDTSIIDGLVKSSYTVEISGIPNPSDVNHTLARDGMDALNGTFVCDRICGCISAGVAFSTSGDDRHAYYLSRVDGYGTIWLALAGQTGRPDSSGGGAGAIHVMVDSLDGYSVIKFALMYFAATIFSTWNNHGTTPYVAGIIPLYDNDNDFNCNPPSISNFTFEYGLQDAIGAGGANGYPYYDATHNWDGCDAVITV